MAEQPARKPRRPLKVAEPEQPPEPALVSARPLVDLSTDRRGAPVSQAAVELVMQCEGLLDGDPRTPNLDPYICPTGYVTAGWGHTLRDPKTRKRLTGEAGLARARELWPGGFPLSQCRTWLRGDLAECATAVDRLIEVELNANERGALTSFIFNLGTGEGTPLEGFDDSTLRRKLNAGDRIGAAAEFKRWNKGRDPNTGALKVLGGLTTRRQLERELFLRPLVPDVPKISTTNKAGLIGTAATGTVGVISAAGDDPVGTISTGAGYLSQLTGPLAQVREFLVGVGVEPATLVLLVAAGALGTMGWLLWKRMRG